MTRILLVNKLTYNLGRDGLNSRPSSLFLKLDGFGPLAINKSLNYKRRAPISQSEKSEAVPL